MGIERFLESFKAQLEDMNISITEDTDYVKAEFWDSLTAMVVKVMIEDEYNVDIPVEIINQFSTLKELFIYIKDRSNG
ncbi:acyl carrier protein [Sphingobacterium siyangense]|uniref:acyl carrier protein n=1 Tax=Sphingobacterium siyangense TaxID=459529 RepID=UPI003DA1DA7C